MHGISIMIINNFRAYKWKSLNRILRKNRGKVVNMLSIARKKVFLLVVSLVLISLFSNAASAQEGGIGEGLGSAFDTIRQLFAFLPELITLEGLLGEEPAAIFWAKFLVWLFLFAVVYFGASAIPGMKESKNIAIVIAIVISLMGALLIPNDILVNIFQTYGLLAGIILWIIPVAAGMFIAHKVTLPFFRALVYGTAAWILWSINATVVDKMGFANTSFPYFSLLFAVVVIMFFWNLVGIFWGGQGQAAAGGWLGDRGRDAWDWATRDRSGDRGLLGGRREPRTAEEQQRLVDEAQRVRESITDLERELAMNLETEDELESLNQLAGLIRQLDDVQNELIRLERI